MARLKRLHFQRVPINVSPKLGPVLQLPALTMRILGRYWPQLMALWVAGIIGNLLLNELAAFIGRLNTLAGLSSLSLVVLLKLVVIVGMFQIVRPALPALDAAAQAAANQPVPTATEASTPGGFASVLTLTLVPFFAFYAAWGFLSDTVRDYSKLVLDLMMAGESGNLLQVSGGTWLFVSVAVAWAVRRFAKFMHKRSKAAVWPLVIVICEANWAFIALFVVSNWEGEIRAWIGEMAARIGMFLGFLDPVREAAAGTILPPPPEAATPPLSKRLNSLFLYGLYPVVWMTLAAVVYGYDIANAMPLEEGRLARAVSRWQAMPKAVRDFVSHFIAGTIKRYRALAEGVGLTLRSGLGLLLTTIVLFRLLDWGSAWAWYGITQLVGPHEFRLWQIIAQGISLFLGSPSAPGDGVLVMPIKICLLAAALEIGFAQGRAWHGRR